MSATVIYDNSCGICKRFKQLVTAIDITGHITWQPLQTAAYDDLPVDRDACLDALHTVNGETVHAGFYAVRRICRHVPLLWPCYVAMVLPGVPFIGERVYRFVSDHRHCTI
jgi:predicted DCC family thiol-disulfide oxidoreductase YuxK